MNVKIDISDLKLVRLIAEDGSLTSAAKRMHVSQSAASQRLANLAARFGTDLFARRDGLMRPTVVGSRLVSAASAVNVEIESALSDICKLVEEKEQLLRITTQCYTCYRWLPFLIRDMREQHPSLTVDVIPEATDNAYAALSNDRVDIAIVSYPEADSEFEEIALFDDELFAVMSSEHPFATRQYLNPSNFADETLVLYTGKAHAILNEVLHPAGVTPARVVQVRITEAIVELARSGQGIAVLAGWAFNDLDDQTGLTRVRITKRGFKRTWRAVVSNDCPPERASSFAKCVSDIGGVMGFDDWRNRLREQPRKRSVN